MQLHSPDIVADLHTVESLIHRIEAQSVVNESKMTTEALSKVVPPRQRANTLPPNGKLSRPLAGLFFSGFGGIDSSACQRHRESQEGVRCGPSTAPTGLPRRGGAM